MVCIMVRINHNDKTDKLSPLIPRFIVYCLLINMKYKITPSLYPHKPNLYVY